MIDKNCLSFWFPRLRDGGIPVPRTMIVDSLWELTPIMDGKLPRGWDSFVSRLKRSVLDIGLPCFLRTGQGSGKHQWRDTCYLERIEDMTAHVGRLVEWSAIADMIGLPTNVWAVREMLPVEPVCVLPAYNDFPLVRECRAFVGKGEVACMHSYWPRGAVEEGFPFKKSTGILDDGEHDLPPNFEDIVREVQSFDVGSCLNLASRVADIFKDDGSWSVDMLETKGGKYFVTDMALASRSFHWEDCPNRKLFKE